MASIIFRQGSKDVSVPAGEKIAVFSNVSVKVFEQVGYPNQPLSWNLLTQTTAGTQYVSSAFTPVTLVRIEAGADEVFYETGSNPSVAEPQTDITAADATFDITGLAAAQGGYTKMTGGASSTAGNDGGESGLVGGVPGATSAGGAATLTGGIGGATSGVGGAATITGGVGTAGNSAGGVATCTGGAGQGSAAGGAVSATGGAGGATGAGGAVSVVGGIGGATSGTGGVVNVTGGAGTNGDANGGNVLIAGGAKDGTGLDGLVMFNGIVGQNQPTPTAKTTAVTLTIAEMITKLITGTHTVGGTAAYTLPTGTLVDAGLPAMAVDDSFDWVLINLSAAAADTITVTAGTGHTIVGIPIVQSVHSTTGGIYGNASVWRTRKTASNVYVSYRIG